MGKLIKNHWARLIVLSGAAIQLLAALEGFLYPKVFWDFANKLNKDGSMKPFPVDDQGNPLPVPFVLDGMVNPFPTLQVINLILSLIVLAWEWPLGPLVKALPGLHRSIEARLVLIPLVALLALLLYQATNAGLYYLIGTGIYFWAFCEGETVCPEPWTLPKRNVGKADPGKV